MVSLTTQWDQFQLVIKQFYVDSGLTSATNATTAAKTVGTSSGQFEAENMSIAFNVNDDLSISYAETEETYDARDGSYFNS